MGHAGTEPAAPAVEAQFLNLPVTREDLVCFFFFLVVVLSLFSILILFFFLLLPVGLSETSNTRIEDTMVAGRAPILVEVPWLFLHHIHIYIYIFCV